MNSANELDPSIFTPAGVAADAPGEPKRRAVRRDRVRAELIAIGLEHFRSKGFDATTVNDIAETAGLSPRTFFRYFRSKDDVAFDWIEVQGHFMVPALRARPIDESPLKAMMEAFLQLADQHDRHAEFTYFRTRLIFSTPALSGRYYEEQAKWGEQMMAALKHHAHTEEERYTLRVQVSIAITAFVVAVRSWVEAGKGGSLRPWVEQAFAATSEASVPGARVKLPPPKTR